MKLTAIFLAALFQTIFGRSLTSRIIGGTTANAGEFPWQAAVYLHGDGIRQFCSGAIVSHRFVLTAAHCAAGGRDFTIQIGSNTLQSPDANRVTLATSTKIMNPNYNPDTYENDLALLQFHLTVTLTAYIQPIPLENDASAIADDSQVTITGWGQINDQDAGVVNDLQFVDLVVIPNQECQGTYGDAIVDNMVCAVGNFDEGICIGDTGTALVARQENGIPILAGIATFYSGRGCETSDPSGFTRTYPYIDWIKETIAE